MKTFTEIIFNFIFFIAIILIVMWFIKISSADIIKEPPHIEDKATSEYMKILYDTNDVLPIVTTNPNGSRRGTYGQLVILATGSILTLKACISSPSGTTWQQVQ